MLEYHICYSLDSKYAEQLAVSVTSIIKNSTEQEHINFYILDGGLTDEDKNKIEDLKRIKDFNLQYITVNPQDFTDCPMLKDKSSEFENYHVTIPTYFRFKLPSYLPNLNRVLYLDCDVIITKSLKELYETELEDYACAMVPDVESEQEAERLKISKYFNAGVMLINLDYWRSNNIGNKLFGYAKANKDNILWQDQDIINVVLDGKIKELDNIWNFQYFQYDEVDRKKLQECNIFHLAGRFKPWIMSFEHAVYDLYYDYLSYTSWKNKIVEYKLQSSGKHLKDNIGGKKTNIVVMTTDKDLQDTYKDLNNAYSYVNTLEKTISAETDTKLSQMYEEIKKTYDFVKTQIDDSEFKTSQEADEKISQIYDEIKKSYSYVQERIHDSEFKTEQEANEKIAQVYDEIKKSYDFIKDSIKDSEFKTEQESNEKIEKVYDEIKKSYDFIENSIKDSEFKTEQEANEKIEKVYDEIKKSYEFIENSIKDSEFKTGQEADEKIAQVYDEIKKSYDFVTSSIKDSEFRTTQEANDKINEVYEEIKRAYEFVKTCMKDIEYKISSKLNDKIDRLYSEIAKTYDFIKTSIKDSEYNTNTETNDKITEIYKEIEHSYEFVKNSIKEAEFKNIADINDKVTKVYEEITNAYDFIKKSVKDTESSCIEDSNEKINLVYEEISKNYKFTEKLYAEIKEITEKQRGEAEEQKEITASQIEKLHNRCNEIEQSANKQKSLFEQLLSQNIEKSSKDTDEKIEDIIAEINKSTKFSEYLVEISQDKQEQLLNKEISTLNSKLDEVKTNSENNLQTKTNDLYYYIDTKTTETQNDIKNQLEEFKADMLANQRVELNNVMSYTNEQTAKSLKELCDTSNYLEGTFNNKLEGVYNNNDNMRIELDTVKQEVYNKIDAKILDKAISDLKSEIETKDLEQDQKLQNLKNDYEEKIKAQKQKYEHKIAAMEKQLAQINSNIKEMKKSPIKKLMEKLMHKSEKRK